MGVTDVQNLAQLRKMQGETNERLDHLLRAVERTNQLLEWLGQLIQTAPQPPRS